MKVKTSISLSSNILEKVQQVTSEGTRSEFIEMVLWRYFDSVKRDIRDQKDEKILNDAAERLNIEANDILGFQIQV